jgi:phage tail sheath gpL-like
MAISFNEIPSALRVPFVAIEFAANQAQQGPALQVYKALLIGQMTAAGTATEGVPVLVTSVIQAETLFGKGSNLHSMVDAFLKNNKVTELHCIPLDDNGAGAQATGSVDFAGTATAAGTLHFYIAGRKVEVAVASGDDQDDMATNLVAAITGSSEILPVSAAVNGGDASIVDLTALHKGDEVGNKIDLRFNYQAGEEFPAGITDPVITDMSGGTTNPDIATAISGLGDTQYNVIGIPWVDASNLTKLEDELEDRWGPLVQLEGQAFASEDDSQSNLQSLGNGRNSQFLSIVEAKDSPAPPWEYASSIAGLVAFHGSIDPGRPFQTLEMKGIKAPALADRFNLTERNTLLFNSISTTKIAPALM